MNEQIEQLLDIIRQDFAQWGCPQMVEKFNEELVVKDGRKYIKVCTRGGNSVWGFIVKGEDTKFKKGDILKAAAYNAPARNHARGNILEGDFSWVRWTGPAYC